MFSYEFMYLIVIHLNAKLFNDHKCIEQCELA